MVDVRMNYASMDKMQIAFGNAYQQIEDSVNEMKKLAKMMEDGALQGLGGDAFRNAILQKLIPRMKVLADKMQELDGDIHGAVRATRDGVKTAQSRFK